MAPFLAAIVALTNSYGIVSVDTHGARVVSYVPEGGEEVLFVSKTGTGGVPLCWPWFAGLGPEGAQRHGLARYCDFKVVGKKRYSSCGSELILRLESDEQTRKLFPHDFALTVSVRLNDRLTLSMTGENTGSRPFEVTEAFHPYLAVGDSPQCREERDVSGEWRLHDPVLGRTVAFTDEGGSGRRLWRPNPESHLSKTVSPIEPDDWRKFICPENGTLEKARAYVLKPGESHTLTRTIRLASTHNNAKPIDLQPQIEAVAAAGGGRVTVPPGEWLSKGAVHLRSNVELHLDEGAVLVFPDDPEAYLPAVRSSYSCIEFYGLSPLIYAYGATNVSVTGGGTLTTRMGLWRDWFMRETATMDANQRRLYSWGESDTPVEERRFEDLRTARIRPAFVEFERCANVRLENFRLRYSPLWCVHLRLCDGVCVRGIDIRARGHNNDGIDVDASRNVLIEGCTLDQGDDAFVIKSGRDRDGRRVGVPCENVEIRNCTVKRAHTLIGVGSEVAGGVRNISLHDCRVTERANAVIRVKTSDRKGAYIENVAVSNVEISAAADIGALVSLITDIDYQWKKYPPREHIVTRIDGFRVENVRAHGTVRKVYALYGDARLPPENIVIRDVTAASIREPSVAKNIGKCELPPARIMDDAAALDLQGRIDACSASGGGVVRVTQGRYVDMMPIVLKSNVELHLEAGAVLQATTNYGAYAYMPGWNRGAFITALGATNIAITGEGRIECSGDRAPFVAYVPGRWRGIHLFRCRNVRLERFSLSNAHSWGCYLHECDGVTVKGLSIFNHSNHNNDGLDIASRNVTVEDCDIDSEDDALVFKNHNPDFVVENVTVRNCRLSSNTSFIKIGTETWGGFRNIRVSDCELDCRTFLSKRGGYWGVPGVRSMFTGGAGLSVMVVDGGFAEDIVYSRIRMKRGIMSPVFIRLDKRNARADGKPTYLRNVTIEDVEMERPTTSYIASSVTGASGLRPSDITLRRIRVRPLACLDAEIANEPVPGKEGVYPGCRMFGCALPAYGFYLRHADRIAFEGVSIEPTDSDIRKPFVAEDATYSVR